jgi:hypothetical protein
MHDFEDVEPEAKADPFETKTEKSSTAKRAAPKDDFEDEIPF